AVGVEPAARGSAVELPYRTREGGAHAGGQRQYEQGYGAEALDQRGHGQAPLDQHLRQNRRVESARAGALCNPSSFRRESVEFVAVFHESGGPTVAIEASRPPPSSYSNAVRSASPYP